jgi:ectoine hydroxylase-related dioxygenase (phytanoyl-CoA dioxygenase family)
MEHQNGVRVARPTRRAFLETAQIEQFFSLGWLVLPRLFAPREIQRMSRAFERLRRHAEGLPEAGDYRGSRFVIDRKGAQRALRIHRVVWCGACEPVLGEYGADPRLLHPVAELLGSVTMNQLINQAHYKIPGDGVEFDWHQDSTHRRYGHPGWTDVNGRGSYVQTAIAIDAMNQDNGPLRFIPGSGRLGHVADPGFRVPEERAVALTMNPGDVVMFGPYIFHSSEPNRSDGPRRALINGYAAPGANRRVYPGQGSGRLLYAD